MARGTWQATVHGLAKDSVIQRQQAFASLLRPALQPWSYPHMS